MLQDAQVIEYRELPDIEANDVNNSILDSMNQEVHVGDRESYANEVHSEGMFILDGNVDALTEAPNEDDVQPIIQVNEESTIIANNSFIIPHEYSKDIQKSDRLQSKFEIDQAIGIHVDVEFIIPNIAFMDNTLHLMSRLESEHVDLFIPNDLLVGKKLHPLIALLLFLEKLKALQFFHLRSAVKLFLYLDSFFPPMYKTRGRVFSNQRRMMRDKDKGELRRYGYILILAYVKYFYNLLSL